MRTILIAICFSLMTGFASCSFFGKSDTKSYVGNNADVPERDLSELKDSLKDIKDTLNYLRDEISLISGDVKDIQSAISEHEGQIKELNEAKSEKYFWILAGLCLLCLIIAIIALIKVRNVSYVYDTLNDHFNSIKSLEDSNGSIKANINKFNRDSQEVAKKVNSLSDKIDELDKTTKSVINTLEKSNFYGYQYEKRETKPSPIENNKTAVYFGNVIGGNPGLGYFRKHLTSRSDEAVFSGSINQNIASFKPLDLNVLKGNDNALKAVDLVAGSVRTQDATSMNVIASGTAVNEAGRWNIKEKVKIKLS